MAQLVSELYDALRAAGVEDDLARAAAKSVISIQDREHLATKADIADLRVLIAETKTEIIRWNVITMGFMTALFSGLITLLKLMA
jgi:hypothetical protein